MKARKLIKRGNFFFICFSLLKTTEICFGSTKMENFLPGKSISHWEKIQERWLCPLRKNMPVMPLLSSAVRRGIIEGRGGQSSNQRPHWAPYPIVMVLYRCLWRAQPHKATGRQSPLIFVFWVPCHILQKCGYRGRFKEVPGGTQLEWGCAVLKTPFSRLSCSSQGSYFKQTSLKVSSQDPLLRKIWKF